ncbi:FAD-dependent oxidoreductase [Fodinicola acaciae]|uniref:FAD-dependent oxidoreductase n=1 Tax=Fodinicola acaciae TaxID=2681555 RepID=UPI0013D2E66B|nr:FAD-dependent oxidoreductase [Fodinicola acaciae]
MNSKPLDCVVVGGGPAGMMLGLLLARAGVEVAVLEKHGDFLRDFRGDTVHASTLTLLDELGLGARFAAMPHRLMERMSLVFGGETATLADFSLTNSAHKHIAMVPQWDLLDLLADEARTEPTFHLHMNTAATDLIVEDGRVAGVRTTAGDMRARLTVAADGRHSKLRAGDMEKIEYAVPMDVWWFRLPRADADVAGGVMTFNRGHAIVAFDRGDYYQAAYLLPKGKDAELRAQGLPRFLAIVEDLLPWTRGRLDTIGGWDDVKFLDVRLNRLKTWHAEGLLAIGDAAHAMSPMGGVGINLAVQDAVAAARILAGPLRRGDVTTDDLAKVQRRRELPTIVTQDVQRMMHRVAVEAALSGRLGDNPPAPARVISRFSFLQRLPAQFVGVGVRPEHIPSYARRSPATHAA